MTDNTSTPDDSAFRMRTDEIAHVNAPPRAADLTNAEIREWVLANEKAKHPARLEVVRLLREQSYVALREPTDDRRSWTAAQWDPIVRARAEAILDTPVDKLAAMVVMTDTVVGNWRTIAATVTAVY